VGLTKIFVEEFMTKQNKPTQAELEILSVIWERETATVREVHEVLNKRKPIEGDSQADSGSGKENVITGSADGSSVMFQSSSNLNLIEILLSRSRAQGGRAVRALSKKGEK